MDAGGSPSDSGTSTRGECGKVPPRTGSSTCWRAGHCRRSTTTCCASDGKMPTQASYSLWVGAASDATSR
jgi:hypothetical protein